MMTSGDKSVVANIRFKFQDKVDKATDEQIAQCWRDFSMSEDYLTDERDERFLEWLCDYIPEAEKK